MSSMDIDEARPDVPLRGPTFEDLTLDDRLNDLERVERYGDSHIALQRLVHVKLISDVAKSASLESIRDRILPLVERRVTDEEFVVRGHLAEQLEGVARALTAFGDAGYELMLEFILGSLRRLVVDMQPEVRIAAGESLVKVAGMLRADDIGARLLTIVLHLAHNSEAEDMRMTGAVLLNEFATTLGPELCQQFVVPELTYLANDTVFRVRKATALNMDAVCRCIGPVETETKLLPSFLRLAEDDIWGVRKACAEAVVCVSKALVPATRVAKLVPLMRSFIEDPSKRVRHSAFQHLGPFLATIPSAAITPAVLKPYLAMATAGGAGRMVSSAAAAGDDELTIFCAFSFPALAMTLGGSRWGDLRQLFLLLARHPEKRVRRPISHSLHDLAHIVGPAATERDLCPVFDLYRRDVEDVRRGVIRGLASFLSSLPADARESRVPVLAETLDGLPQRGWRLRRLFARQLDSLAALFSPVMVFAQVASIAERLLNDEVAAVRHAAAARLAPLLEAVGRADAELRQAVEERLLSRLSSDDARSRITLARALENLAMTLPEEDFLESFLPAVRKLARDPIGGVRRRIAGLLHRSCRAAAALAAATEEQAAKAGEATAAASATSCGTASTAVVGAAASAAADTAADSSSASVPSRGASATAARPSGSTPPASPLDVHTTPARVVVRGSGTLALSPVKGADAVTVSFDDDDDIVRAEEPEMGDPPACLAYLIAVPGMREVLAAFARDTDTEVRVAVGEDVRVGSRRPRNDAGDLIRGPDLPWDQAAVEPAAAACLEESASPAAATEEANTEATAAASAFAVAKADAEAATSASATDAVSATSAGATAASAEVVASASAVVDDSLAAEAILPSPSASPPVAVAAEAPPPPAPTAAVRSLELPTNADEPSEEG